MEVVSYVHTQTRHKMDVSARGCARAAPVMTRSPSPLLIKGVCSRPPRIVVESESSISPSARGSQRLHFQAFTAREYPAFIGVPFLPSVSGDQPGERGRGRAVMARYGAFSLDYMCEEWPIHLPITFSQHKHPSSCIGRRLSEHRRVESVRGAQPEENNSFCKHLDRISASRRFADTWFDLWMYFRCSRRVEWCALCQTRSDVVKWPMRLQFRGAVTFIPFAKLVWPRVFIIISIIRKQLCAWF